MGMNVGNVSETKPRQIPHHQLKGLWLISYHLSPRHTFVILTESRQLVGRHTRATPRTRTVTITVLYSEAQGSGGLR